MAKTIKKYQLLQVLSLSTHFRVNGNVVPVSFRGGILHPIRSLGRFSTSDPDLQEAIETSNGFNVDYCLESTDVIPEPGDELKKEVVKEVVAEPEPKPVAVPEPVVTDPIVPEPEPVVPEPTPVPKPEPEPGPVPDPNAPVVPTDYPDIINLQEARVKLIELFPNDFKPANLVNKKIILARAKEKNVTFSKLV